MNRRVFRGFLLTMLLASSGFAVWSWFRPYEWSPDSGARYRIQAAELARDHSYFWLTLHLRRETLADHDLRKPVWLETRAGRYEPADTTLGGGPAVGVTEIWLRFWLEEGDLEGPLKLHLNDGVLQVKATSGVPATGDDGRRVFSTNRW